MAKKSKNFGDLLNDLMRKGTGLGGEASQFWDVKRLVDKTRFSEKAIRSWLNNNSVIQLHNLQRLLSVFYPEKIPEEEWKKFLKAREKLSLQKDEPIQKSDASKSVYTDGLHRVIILTGLSSAGKDTLLSHVSNRASELTRPVFFPVKYTTRTPRIEERNSKGEQRSLAYEVRKISSDELKSDNYVGVREIYGNSMGFSKNEIKSLLNQQSGVTVVIIHSYIPDVLGVQEELREFVEELKSNATVELALISTPIEDCWHRLKLRGLPDESRRGRNFEMQRFAEIIKTLKSSDSFSIIIDNSDSVPTKQSLSKLIEFLAND